MPLLADGTEVRIFDSMVWAQPFSKPKYPGPRPQKVSDVLTAGDFVYVEIQDSTTAFLQPKPVCSKAHWLAWTSKQAGSRPDGWL